MHENIKLISIESLIPYALNSRTHSEKQIEQLAESIDEFGFVGAIVVRDGVIAKGHGTLQAIKLLMESGKDIYPPPGRESGATAFRKGFAPVLDASGWSESQFKAFTIADNRLALSAGWDMSLLSSEILDLQANNFDISLLGFDPNELDDILKIRDNVGLVDEDDQPETTENTITKLGDIWLLDKHRVICGNSADINTIESLMNGALADILLTDPPYNVEYKGTATKQRPEIANDKQNNKNFEEFLAEIFKTADIFLKPGASFYIWHADSMSTHVRNAIAAIEWRVHQNLIWVKNHFVVGRMDYQMMHEPCLYGWKQGANHLWASDRKQKSVLNFDKPQSSEQHPTMKPVALIEYQMLNNTRGGDIVLDSFGVSGTTLIAAEKNGRVAYLSELEPKYCDVIVKRWQNYTGKNAILQSTGQSFDDVA
jgi:DNA modification methylase